MHHPHLQNLTLSQTVLLLIALFLVLAFYFLPTIIAIKRKSPHTTAVVILNFFLGVTLLGWIIALVLASKQPQPVVVINNGTPPLR
jgi:RsiW-degrading membrane proteinase PrsW (M82 family)